MVHKNAGPHYTYGYNQRYRHIDALRDSFNNGVAGLYKAKNWIEDQARKIDGGIKTAYSI